MVGRKPLIDPSEVVAAVMQFKERDWGSGGHGKSGFSIITREGVAYKF